MDNEKKQNKKNEIRTADKRIKIGERKIINGVPKLSIKHGKKEDHISLDEIAKGLYSLN